MGDVLLFIGLLGSVASLVLLIYNAIRRRKIKKYLISLGVCFVAVIIGTATIGSNADTKKDTAKMPKKVEQEVQDQQQQEQEEQTEDEPQEEKTQQEINKEMVEEHKHSVRAAALGGIENIEKQKIKFPMFSDYTIAIYSNDSVHNQEGVEFPFSFAYYGQYEEKGTGALRNFIIVIGYENEENIEKMTGYVLQYFNEDTGVSFSTIDPNDDVLQKLMDLPQ